METLDNIATIVVAPFAFLIAFFIGAIVRGILIKDEYKLNAGSILGNILLGVISLIVFHKAFS